MKKLFLAIFLGISFLLVAHYVSAAGLVPCGGQGEPPCQFCHIFVMLNKIANFVLIKFIPPIATLMLVIGGAMFLTSAGNPSQADQGRKIMTSVIIGLVAIYGAWLIVGLFFQSIGLAAWTTNIYKNWWTQGVFQIPGCP